MNSMEDVRQKLLEQGLDVTLESDGFITVEYEDFTIEGDEDMIIFINNKTKYNTHSHPEDMNDSIYDGVYETIMDYIENKEIYRKMTPLQYRLFWGGVILVIDILICLIVLLIDWMKSVL